MNQARAAVLTGYKQPLEPKLFPLPEDLPSGAMLVKVEMAGICGTDVHLWKGELKVPLPVILGHETVGSVVAIGEAVTKDWLGQDLHVGDRITWNSTRSCGQCYYCAERKQPTRCPHRKAYGIGYRCDEPPHFLGGYADYHYLLPGATVFKLPDDLPTETVIGAGCALITAIHGVERTGIEWQDTVVVQGAGPVGLAALAVAKSAGASKVILVGGPSHRLQLAEEFGADEIIDLAKVTNPADRVARVQKACRGYGADVVLECAGVPGCISEGMQMCRDGGKYLILGHYCDAGPIEWNPHIVTRKQLQVFGSWSSEPRHLAAAIRFMQQWRRQFPFERLITHRFGLEQADQALQTTADWKAIKSVIVP